MADCACGRPLGWYASQTGQKLCVRCHMILAGVELPSTRSQTDAATPQPDHDRT
jgi:hypothetical protein